MFNFLKKNCIEEICAPVVGKSFSLEKVPDEMFSNKMLGDGLAFEYEGDTIYSPCDGKIMMVADTNHAVGMKTNSGMEILIHVGLDTVMLGGRGLEVFVKENDKVKKNEPIIKIDRAFMKEKNINLVTPLIITNTSEYVMDITMNEDVDLNSIVLRAKKLKS